MATACACCGTPLPVAGRCGRCLVRPPAFDTVESLYRYEQPVIHLIHALKFDAKLHLALTLGGLLADHIATLPGARPDKLVPVPMHPRRLGERGYNQALELARPLARRLGVAVDFTSCQKIRYVAPQATLSARQRRKNIRGAFCVTSAIGARHVAIVDDVMTTGATAGELARTLKKAGVGRVDVWVCAYAPLSR
jgi:ComF family protein